MEQLIAWGILASVAAALSVAKPLLKYDSAVDDATHLLRDVIHLHGQ